jgi:hypothetical protein
VQEPNPTQIANTVRLKRQASFRASVVVEAGPDVRFYKRLFVDETCDLTFANGKGVTLAVIADLESQGFSSILGVVDSDFDRLNGYSPQSHNLIWSDCHDLETMLIRSQALDKLIQELASETKVDAFERRFGSIRDVLVRAAASIGYLRLYSSRQNLNLRFDGLKYHKCLDVTTLSIDADRLITEVKNNTQRQDLDSEVLRDGMRAVQREGHDVWELCNGHDLLAVLGLGLRDKLGSRLARDVRQDLLGLHLRLAFEDASFKTTNMYREIQTWEKRNRIYVLRQ